MNLTLSSTPKEIEAISQTVAPELARHLQASHPACRLATTKKKEDDESTQRFLGVIFAMPMHIHIQTGEEK
jgi:hypothetical protein